MIYLMIDHSTLLQAVATEKNDETGGVVGMLRYLWEREKGVCGEFDQDTLCIDMSLSKNK